MTNQVFLSLGSNIEPENNLPAAVSHLKAYGKIVAASAVWETEPLGVGDQPDYLNAVVLLVTELSARDIQDRVIPRVEGALGRDRQGHRFGPRTIDIDILLFNHERLQLDHRPIPSPEIETRPFVAIPLAEIAPDYRHPVSGLSLAEIAEQHPADPEAMRLRPEIRLWSEHPATEAKAQK